MPSSSPGSTTRRRRGATGCCARLPATRRSCRSCTAWPASGGSRSSRSTGCRATRGRRRCGSGTRPAGSSSSTCTARCSARSPSCATPLPSAATDESWPFEVAVLEFLEQAWHEPDDGLWESRGGRQHFTASKVAAWVAFDSAVRSAERFELPGPVERWRAARDAIHAEVCARGLRSGARVVHAVVRLAAARRLAARHRGRRVPAGRRPPGRRHRRGHRARAAPRRVRAALPHRSRRRRPAAG